MTAIPGSLGMMRWNCVTYNCPLCFTVLSVGIDPVALKSDTITGVVEALRSDR